MKNQMNTATRATLHAALATLALAALSACSTVSQQAKDQATLSGDSAERAIERIMAPAKAPRVMDTDDFYVSTKAVRVRDDVELLPAMFRLPVKMQVNPRAGLKDLTNQLSRITGLRFAFSADLTEEVTRPTLNNGFSAEQSLKDLLDTLTSQANLSWRFRDGSVDIYRYDTKLFQVKALPGNSEATTTVSNKNTSQGVGATQSTSTNGQDYKQSSKVDFWASTDTEIKQMLTPGKGKSSIAQSTGVITVTDTPQVLANVEAYVNQVNFLRGRNVQVNVQVYSVESSAGQSFDLKFDAVLEKLGKYGMTMASPTSGAIQGAGAISAVVKNANSKFDGSSVLLQALSTVGNTSVVDKFSMVTITGEPAPVNSLTNESYLAKVSVVQPTVAGGSPTYSLEPAVLTYGTSGTLTPTVLSGSELMLRVALDLSSKLALRKASSTDGGSSIQLPETASRSFVHNFNINSGETLLVGFQTNQAAYNSSSMGDPNVDVTLLAGGSRAGNKLNRTLVYAITPLVSAGH